MFIRLKQHAIGAIAGLPVRYFLLLANLFFRFKGVKVSIAHSPSGELSVRQGDVRIAIAVPLRFARYANGLHHTLDALAHGYFLDRIPLNAGDVFLDCGANIGELAVWLRYRQPEIAYVGFEPAVREFESLKKNLPPNGVAVNKGLWNVTGKIDFYMASQTADSSFFPIADFSEVAPVEVVRLDEWVSSGKQIKVLKVEAEGGEPEVLEGAEKILHQCEFIVVDSSAERGLNKSETTSAVVNFLVRRGFDLVAITHKSRVTCLFQKSL